MLRRFVIPMVTCAIAAFPVSAGATSGDVTAHTSKRIHGNAKKNKGDPRLCHSKNGSRWGGLDTTHHRSRY
jgi:hypothetical protein